MFDLTGSGLEDRIYHTRGEQANHYTTDGDFISIHDVNNMVYVKQVMTKEVYSGKTID